MTPRDFGIERTQRDLLFEASKDMFKVLTAMVAAHDAGSLALMQAQIPAARAAIQKARGL